MSLAHLRIPKLGRSVSLGTVVAAKKATPPGAYCGATREPIYRTMGEAEDSGLEIVVAASRTSADRVKHTKTDGIIEDDKRENHALIAKGKAKGREEQHVDTQAPRPSQQSPKSARWK